MNDSRKKTLFKKIIEGILALGGFFGLASITDIKLPFNLWSSILISVIFIIIILHSREQVNMIIKFFKGMDENIKYIKENVHRRKVKDVKYK